MQCCTCVRRLSWLALGLLLACPGPAGPVDVEIIDYDAQAGEWRLATSSIDTVTDLNQLTGRDFDIKGNQVLSIDMVALKAEDPNTVTSERMRELVIGREGDPVQLSYSMVQDGGTQVVVANDFESLAMMTLFHHVEKVWAFARDVGGDRSGATSSRTMLGFYATVGAKVGIDIPLLTADNAAFLPMSDSFVILRAQFIEGIPFPMNSGVIAHEFSHRVFHHNVYAGSAMPNWYQHMVIDGASGGGINNRIFVLLKALDEGSADVFAIAYTRRPDFIVDSLQGDLAEATRIQRDVEGPFADWATYDRLRFESWSTDAGQDVCKGLSEDYGNTGWNFYCLGTVWARSLWDASGRDAEVLRAQIVPAMLRAFARLGSEVLASDWRFDFEFILDLVVQEAPAELHDALCTAFADKFASRIQRVNACP